MTARTTADIIREVRPQHTLCEPSADPPARSPEELSRRRARAARVASPTTASRIRKRTPATGRCRRSRSRSATPTATIGERRREAYVIRGVYRFLLRLRGQLSGRLDPTYATDRQGAPLCRKRREGGDEAPFGARVPSLDSSDAPARRAEPGGQYVEQISNAYVLELTGRAARAGAKDPAPADAGPGAPSGAGGATPRSPACLAKTWSRRSG
jgi:hypothetical protein